MVLCHEKAGPMNHSTFAIEAEWKGGLGGQGFFSAAGLESSYSVPQSLKGAGIGTNPEELLGAAAASCYLITLSVILQYQGLKAERLRIRTEMELKASGTPQIVALKHFPVIEVSRDTTDETIAQITDAMERADQVCLIAQALRPNVKINVEGRIERK